ncbi:hypothetical protein AB0G87_15180 [Streptomyces asoensis]|uniref:hypothetical protein n=1 Tax=Streptomyces asoensis TaxID=249586 RepID=UPI0033C9A17D
MTEDGVGCGFNVAPMATGERERGALAVLRTAREAARLLGDPAKKDALNDKVDELWVVLGGLLEPELPAPMPLDGDAQAQLIADAGELAVLLRAYDWADADFAPAEVEEAVSATSTGERAAAEGFDALGKLILPSASAEGWAAEVITRAAEGDKRLERAVKLVKYALHPTPLLILDDLTKMGGEVLRSLNIAKLNACVDGIIAAMTSGFLTAPYQGPDDIDPVADHLAEIAQVPTGAQPQLDELLPSGEERIDGGGTGRHDGDIAPDDGWTDYDGLSLH